MMNDLPLKHAFRLTRWVALACLFYHALGLLSIAKNMPLQLFESIGTGILLLATVGFLIINEWLARRFKSQNRQPDPALIEKASVLFPLVTGIFLAVNYLISGQMGLVLMMAFPVLLAQLLGHLRLVKVMIMSLGLLYVGLAFVGYPHLYGFSTPITLYGSDFPKLITLQVLPFMAILFYHSKTSAGLMVSAHDKVSKLQNLAATDALTGLVNRRQFNHQLHAEVARARRNQKPLTLALFDIDDFKKINDIYGHLVGDRILNELGALIIHNVRESDIPARYGGEEFALILPETKQLEAYEILERLRKLVAGTVFCLPDSPITLSISVGISQMDPRESTVFECVEAADQALYEAKKQGKNCVIYGIVPVPKIELQPRYTT